MGASWQTPDQKTFIAEHLSSYIEHSSGETLKTLFWPNFLDKWFEAWPVPEPPAELAEGGENAQGATKGERAKKTAVSTVHLLLVNLNSQFAQQLKRVFKSLSDDVAVGGRRALNLQASCRRRSEVRLYMTLYYDTRIRPTVVKEWDEAELTNMNFSSHPEIPEDQVDSEDSHLLKDIRIPLCFKNNVAQRLYEAEEEVIKEIVRSKREEELLVKTPYNTRGEERQELIQEYQKCAGSSMPCVLD
jgi:hypothetical protein